ncbi:hypothetical protein GQ44DRAFT_683526 [Phaeosphaeriaceae sp. PMI808]|nr:hypothetical protein GQ44DRAFT_683526 [Phaeosphaeriaceae sp. PMI808]
MGHYVDIGTQTNWAGLMQQDFVRVGTILSSRPDTTTPPDNMLTDKVQTVRIFPSSLPRQQNTRDQASTSNTMLLLERRMHGTGLQPYISLPPAELNDEVPMSPPSTQALLSPLPEANRLHAGHTPLRVEALSPRPEAATEAPPEIDNNTIGPLDGDEALTGPLTLPTNPVDGADDHHIALDVLDQELGRFARQQAILRGDFSHEDPTPKNAKPVPEEGEAEAGTTGGGVPLSRKGSADSRRSGASEEIDGVTLKTPRNNFGAPFGSL